MHRRADLRSRRRDTAFIHPSRTVDWNHTVKLSVGPKFTGEMESLVFPAIYRCSTFLPWPPAPCWPLNPPGCTQRSSRPTRSDQGEPRWLPCCDIALHLERADALVPDRYGSKYLTSSQLHPGSGFLVQTGCLPSGLEGAERSGAQFCCP